MGTMHPEAVGLGGVRLTFTAETALAARGGRASARHWEVTARAPGRHGFGTVTVGEAVATVVSLGEAEAAGVSLLDVFDDLGGSVKPLYELYDAEEGWWNPDLEVATPSGAALVLEFLAVRATPGDGNLATALAAGVVGHLGVGCDLAVLHPRLTGPDCVARWDRLGFARFHDVVWVLDLHATRFRDACAGLLAGP